MNEARATKPKIIFITGTGTDVGKTLLMALLLSHLRQQGCDALAMKPFCSGSEAGLTDVDILYRLQDQKLATHEINPFFFPEPLAPLVAARRHRVRITLDDVLQRIRSVISDHLSPIQHRESRIQHPVLLIEGAGGLLAPLGEGFNLLDIITAMVSPSGIPHPTSRIQTIIVARNQLGTINHTLLTIQALQNRFQTNISSSDSGFFQAAAPNAPSSQFTIRASPFTSVVLMDPEHKDASSSSNAKVLAELRAPIPIHSIPFLGEKPLDQRPLQTNLKKVKRTLNRILG